LADERLVRWKAGAVADHHELAAAKHGRTADRLERQRQTLVRDEPTGRDEAEARIRLAPARRDRRGFVVYAVLGDVEVRAVEVAGHLGRGRRARADHAGQVAIRRAVVGEEAVRAAQR